MIARDVGADPDPTPTVRLAPDLDPTPTATPWQEYLAAAQSLDAVFREAAESATAAKGLDANLADLAQVHSRLDHQRARLLGEAVRAGVPAPQTVPTPAERAEADARLAGDPAAIGEALRHCRQLADTADAQLAAAPAAGALGSPIRSRPPRPSWPPPLWLVIAAPLTAATLLLCGISILLFVVR